MLTAVRILDSVFGFYQTLIFVYILMSWFPLPGFLSELRGVIGTFTEPYLSVFRKLIPSFSGLDFSPIIAIIVLGFIQRFVVGLLLGAL